jgi:alpha-tubulin suppressor-like RCC1 family protein
MFAWGWAASGRLCVKADEDDSATGAASARKSLVKPPPVQWQPRPVLPALFGNPSIRITQVACAAHNGYALSDAGAVFAWGRAGPALGLGPDGNTADKHTPTAISSFLNLKVLRIAAYGAVASAVLDGGRLFMWGQSDFMESATFNAWEAHTPDFIDAFGGTGVHTLAIGEKHFLALLDNKQVCSWGSSDFGQLGHGTFERQVKPRVIEALAEVPVERVFAAPDYSLCISSSGKAFSWGNAGNGTLGLALDTLTPQHFVAEKNCVVSPAPVEAIRSGYRVKSIAPGRKSCLFLCGT